MKTHPPNPTRPYTYIRDRNLVIIGDLTMIGCYPEAGR